MLSTLIGQFDWPSTAVVVGSAFAVAMAMTAWLNRTPFRIQEMKAQAERDTSIANISRQREVDLAKLQQNLITSHRSEEG